MNGWVGLICLVLLAGGCVPHSGYVAVDYVPRYYDRYPSTYYNGRPVYFIQGRWYARGDRGRWGYYRREPPALYRHRTGVVHAPPAYDYRTDPRVREPSFRAPPARRVAPPARYSAPPARQSAPPARQSAPPARQSAPPARQSAPPAR